MVNLRKSSESTQNAFNVCKLQLIHISEEMPHSLAFTRFSVIQLTVITITFILISPYLNNFISHQTLVLSGC